MIPLVFGALLLIPQAVHGYSFAGSDWLLDMYGTVHVRTTLANMDEPFSEVDTPTTITQTSENSIIIPISFTDPLTLELNVSGSVTGTQIVATAYVGQTDEFEIEVEGVTQTLRLKEVNARLEGNATSINSADLTGGYGPRVYGITGAPSPDSYITVDTIEWKFLGSWFDIGNAWVDVDSWQANRSAGVPEPGTIAMLLGLAASLVGYGLWRRRS